MGVGASSPYEVDANEVDSVLKRRAWWWKLYSGKEKEGAEKSVSVFRASLADLGDKAALPKNAFSRTKTLRHPHILKFVDGSEDEKEVMVVTEAVTPLVDWLDSLDDSWTSEQRSSACIWGLRCVMDAVEFLHTQGLVHGLLCPEAIFVTSAGEFKLWALDLVSNPEQGATTFRAHESLLGSLSGSAQFRSPERLAGEWDKVSRHFQAVDVWSLGETIPGLFGQGFEVPPDVAKAQKRMVVSNPMARPKVARLVASDVFSSAHPFVELMLVVEQINLKSTDELVAFYKGLASAMRFVPTQTRIHRLVPALESGIVRSIGPDRRPEETRTMVSATLPVLSEIGSSMTGDEYRSFVVPAVLPLFTVRDRAVRMQLLERIEGLVKHMDAGTINGPVFEALLAGFADTAKILRELTLKSMLALAPKLNEKNLTERLCRALAKLQSDPEPSIRTNTTIFYGKIAPHLASGVRVRVVLPAFLKACKDPFPYARLAAVRATSACKQFYDPGLIVSKVLPTIVTLLLDPYGPVRDAAQDCITVLLEPVRVASEAMKKEEEARRAKHEADEAKRIAKEGPKIAEIQKAAPASSAESASPLKSLSGLKLGGAVKHVEKGALPPPSALGFKTPSDSAFWDAIEDEAPAAATGAAATQGGWDDEGWGGGDDLDGLDDEDLEDMPQAAAPAAAPAVATPPRPPAEKLGLKPPSFERRPTEGNSAKKSVAERRAEAAKKKDLSAKKLPVGIGGDEGWDW